MITSSVHPRVEFDAELEGMQTEQGIWDDGTIFYVFGQKTAITHKLILVTANVREFERVPNLKIENWRD